MFLYFDSNSSSNAYSSMNLNFEGLYVALLGVDEP
jgi:hypothetical protein